MPTINITAPLKIEKVYCKMLDYLPGVKRFACIQRLAFRGLGIDVTSVECKIFRPFYLWLPLMCTILLSLALIKYIWENIDDLEKVAEALAPVLQYSLCITKAVIFLYKRKAMAKLMHNIWILPLEGKIPLRVGEKKTTNIFYNYFYVYI